MPLFDGEPFERVMAILIAMVIIATAGVAYLESLASDRADIAERTAQQFVIENMGIRARSEIEMSYAFDDALRLWYSLDTLGFVAEDRGEETLAGAYYAARDRVETLTPLLQEPYFDLETTDVNGDLFESDRYLVDLTFRTEKFKNFSNLEDQWEQKAQRYIAQLTILAVSLFLFGLSNTIMSRVRWLFVVMGGLLTTSTLIWTFLVSQSPIVMLPDSAMFAYAEGDALLMQGRDDEALEKFALAIDMVPTYALAYEGRAAAYGELDQLENQIADYEQAVALGLDDNDVLTELGFAHYLAGNFETARDYAQQRIDRGTGIALDYFDLGLFHLVDGNIDMAVNAYQEGVAVANMQVARRRVNNEGIPSDLFFNLDIATFDLMGVSGCIVDGVCDGLPAEITPDTTVAITADSLSVWLREVFATLEYNRETMPYSPDKTPVALYFADADTGDVSDEFNLDTINFEIDTRNLTINAGQRVLVKAFVDDEEDEPLRVLADYQPDEPLVFGLGEDTVFAPFEGFYRIDLYVDFELVGSGTFVVIDTDTATVAVSDAGEFSSDTYGFSVAYPAQWSPVLEEDDGFFIIEHEDSETVIYMFVVFDVDNDLNATVDFFGEDFGVLPSEGRETVQVDGQDALAFTYTVEDVPGIAAKALAVVQGANGIVFAVESENPAIDLDAVLSQMQINLAGGI